MKMSGMKKIQREFSLSKSTKIYLREREISAIQSFIGSEHMVLHICGNPGTGKTNVSTKLLGKSALYLNYYNETDVQTKIKSGGKHVVIIDEFDKYYDENKNDCIQIMCYMRNNGIKLITLSNNLKISAEALFFEPYTSSDIEMILKKKLIDEFPVEIIISTVTRLISKRMGTSGDLRMLFRYVQEILENKLLNNDMSKISVEDINLEKENRIKIPNDIHHYIISTLVSKNRKISRMELYSKYLKECLEMKIQSYDRTDFNIIYDIYD